jgi:NADH-quinone oxidoreductase subunit E
VSVLSPHIIDEIKAMPARYPQPRSAVMPALDLAQEELGYLSSEAMTEVAAALQLDPGYVEGVATFYSLFHLEPIGEHHFYVCTNLSCTLRGANDIVDHLKQQIGVKNADEISKDGLFSYEEVECLGACEKAPMMRFEHKYHYDLTNEKVDALVAERRSSSTSRPASAPHPNPLPEGERELPSTARPAPHPHPPASPATSPASGEVTHPLPPAPPATSPASGEVKKRRKKGG